MGVYGIKATGRQDHQTNAERQAAYRKGLLKQRDGECLAKKIPILPAVASMPGHRRWQAMLTQAQLLVECAVGEMEAYFDQRSELWQNSEQGETFTELLESMQDALSALAEVPY